MRAARTLLAAALATAGCSATGAPAPVASLAPATAGAEAAMPLAALPDLPPAPTGAEADVAHEVLVTARAELDALEALTLHVAGTDAAQVVVELTRQIRVGFASTRAVNDAFNPVLGLDSRIDQRVAALVGQGHAWERLSNAILSLRVDPPTSGVVPLPLHPAPGTSTASRWLDVAEPLRRAFDPWTRAVECVAVGRYALALRLARRHVLDDASTRHAAARLAAFEGRLAECIDVVRLGDAEHGIPADRTFAPYVPGEFFRASPGLTLAPPVRVASPPLEAAE